MPRQPGHLQLAALLALCVGCSCDGNEENVIDCDVLSDCPHGFVACVGGRCLRAEDLQDGGATDARTDAATMDRTSLDAPDLESPDSPTLQSSLALRGVGVPNTIARLHLDAKCEGPVTQTAAVSDTGAFTLTVELMRRELLLAAVDLVDADGNVSACSDPVEMVRLDCSPPDEGEHAWLGRDADFARADNWEPPVSADDDSVVRIICESLTPPVLGSGVRVAALYVKEGARLDVAGHRLEVAGDLVAAGPVLDSGGGGELLASGGEARLHGSVFALRLTGHRYLDGLLQVDGLLDLPLGGTLDLRDRGVRAQVLRVERGSGGRGLVMTDPGARVDAVDLSIDGGPDGTAGEFTAGGIGVSGRLVTRAGGFPSEGTALHALDAAHLTLDEGSWLRDLRLHGPEVHLASDVEIRGWMETRGDARLTQTPGRRVRFRSDDPRVVVAHALTIASGLRLDLADVHVEPAGALRLDRVDLHVQNLTVEIGVECDREAGVLGGLVMLGEPVAGPEGDVMARVFVAGDAEFRAAEGVDASVAGCLEWGALVLGGDLTTRAAEQPDVRSEAFVTGRVALFFDAASHVVRLHDPNTELDYVEVNGRTLFETDAAIAFLYLNEVDAAVDAFEGVTFTLGNLPWHPGYRVRQTVLAEGFQVTDVSDVTDSVRLAGDLEVARGGHLDLNGRHVEVVGDLRVRADPDGEPSWLLMDRSRDLSQPTLVVRGDVDVRAAAPEVTTTGALTHGRIDLHGDLVAAGEAWAIDRGAGDASGTTVHLLGEGVTVDVTDPGPGGCRFTDVVVGGEVNVVGEGMYIDGELRVTGTLTVAGPITVTGDLDARSGVVRAPAAGVQPWLTVDGAVLGAENIDAALLRAP